MLKDAITANTSLYSNQWEDTVRFYRDRLHLPVTFSTDWFVEFRLTEAARLSIADRRRSAIESCGGRGVTLALEVKELAAAHRAAEHAGLSPTAIRRHPWGAGVFYLRDPEGHRIEMWQPVTNGGNLS